MNVLDDDDRRTGGRELLDERDGRGVQTLARIDRIVTAPDATTRPRLGSEDEALVALLVAGYSLAEAGAELGYSRRTLQRRLGHLRRALGAFAPALPAA